MGYTLAVLGCGTMGIAVLSGVLASLEGRSRAVPNGMITPANGGGTGTSTPTNGQEEGASGDDKSLPSRFVATVGREESVRRLKRVFRDMGGLAEAVEVRWGEEGNVKAVEESDVVLLCCKPQLVAGILRSPAMQAAVDGKLLISICAGVTLDQLKSYVPQGTMCIRAMPNTPSKIREGMTVVTTLPSSRVLERAIVTSIFTACGRCRFLDEKHFDACTALAGSGPAFVALVLEAMADGGVMMGLPRTEALELAAQTIQGTGRMALSTGLHPAQLKDSVTTPGGCTIAGLLTLEDGRVRSTIARTIQVAANHAAGLGQEKK